MKLFTAVFKIGRGGESGEVAWADFLPRMMCANSIQICSGARSRSVLYFVQIGNYALQSWPFLSELLVCSWL
jgi:hypothetical protein